MQKSLLKLLIIMEQKISMPNSSDSRFDIVQEKIETNELSILPYIVVASHCLISLRNTPSVYLLDAIEIAAVYARLDIIIDGNTIRYIDGHLEKAITHIEKSILQN